MSDRPRVIGVGGLSSDVGKTTLMCELLRAFHGWEAIKTTRGHYRSCGKDPHACCVSHLLTDKPLIRSGREQTYETGKDTGKYWEAGAANVHWLVATDEQIESGIGKALRRVRADGVFVEGNTFTNYVPVDAFVMVVRESQPTIKRSAKLALSRTTALYVWKDLNPESEVRDVVSTMFRNDNDLRKTALNIPCYSSENLAELCRVLRESQPLAA